MSSAASCLDSTMTRSCTIFWRSSSCSEVAPVAAVGSSSSSPSIRRTSWWSSARTSNAFGMIAPVFAAGGRFLMAATPLVTADTSALVGALLANLADRALDDLPVFPGSARAGLAARQAGHDHLGARGPPGAGRGRPAGHHRGPRRPRVHQRSPSPTRPGTAGPGGPAGADRGQRPVQIGLWRAPAPAGTARRSDSTRPSAAPTKDGPSPVLGPTGPGRDPPGSSPPRNASRPRSWSPPSDGRAAPGPCLSGWLIARAGGW